MFNIKLVVFHLIGASQNIYAMWYGYNNTIFPDDYRNLIEKSGAPLKGRSVFLTFINLVSGVLNKIQCKSKYRIYLLILFVR